MWFILGLLVVVAVITKICQELGVEERAEKKLEELAQKEKDKHNADN